MSNVFFLAFLHLNPLSASFDGSRLSRPKLFVSAKFIIQLEEYGPLRLMAEKVEIDFSANGKKGIFFKSK